MVSLKQRQSGFTIVELLIVIVIIGILATLVIVTFSGVQQKARDSERKTDINAVAGQLEAFYANKGYYPPVVDFNSSTFRAANEIRLDTKALADPSTPATESLTAGTGAGKVYYMDAKDGSGAACTAANSQCASYTLTSNLEQTGAGQYSRSSN